jgi:phage tail-like protein
MAINFKRKNSGDVPHHKFNYEVKVAGTTIAGFTEVSGLEAQAEVLEYQEGGVHDSVHTFPDQLSYSNVQLHRGLTAHKDFVKWVTQAMSTSRQKAQKDVTLSLNDRQGNMVREWKLLRAYPVQWSGPEMTAQSEGRFAMEMVELKYEDLTIVK